jgi:acetolactate synthase-1/2/3 large subunit
MTSIGEALVEQLAQRDVDCVFGIPGVHTIELYRGLAASGIRHVTPRHEQGAGFMADGYGRVSGKPGVAFVITGPGLTNTLTAMAQARADSAPMLVVSGMNNSTTIGRGLGCLHELPDQQALARSVALVSERVMKSDDLLPAIDAAFAPFSTGRSGPTHIDVPLDIAGQTFETAAQEAKSAEVMPVDGAVLSMAIARIEQSKTPVIIVGGGARRCGDAVQKLAQSIGAPVVLTANARGVMHGHDLCVPASPSLDAVRQLINDADMVLALGTELGPTDYDMYETDIAIDKSRFVRVDICAHQLSRHDVGLAVHGDAASVLTQIETRLRDKDGDATATTRAKMARDGAWAGMALDMQACTDVLNAARDVMPNAIMVGDSTQLIYAGNLYYDHDRAGGWFNASTGFGALGFGIPAAIGAQIAAPDARVICFVGDGGAQFSLPEVMVAVEENLPVIFVIWNNHGYQEIATSMQAVDITVVGCDPTPPDFCATAASFGVAYFKTDVDGFGPALAEARDENGPVIVEIIAPNLAHEKD